MSPNPPRPVATVMDRGRRIRRRRLRGGAAGLAGATAIAIAVTVSSWPDGPSESLVTDQPPISSTTTTLAPPPSTAEPTTIPDGPPSQSPEDAMRDSVVAEVAQLSLAARSGELLQVESELGTWAISRLSRPVEEASYIDDGCGLGRLPDGAYPTEIICTSEYGELLLLDDDGSIIKAFPMPGARPTWLAVANGTTFVGREGDGGLPDSVLGVISHETLEGTFLWFPAEIDGWVTPTPGWYLVDTDTAALYTTIFVDGTGVETASWTRDDLSIDPAAAWAAIEQVVATIPPLPPLPSGAGVVVQVVNATLGTSGIAGQLTNGLEGLGWTTAPPKNADARPVQGNSVYYRAGYHHQAEQVSYTFDPQAALVEWIEGAAVPGLDNHDPSATIIVILGEPDPDSPPATGSLPHLAGRPDLDEEAEATP